MDYLQTIIGKFHFREGREKKRNVIPFMSMVKQPAGTIQHAYYYAQRDRIINAIRMTKEETKRIYAGYDLMTASEKDFARSQAWEIKQACIEEIEKMSSTPSTMYLVLRDLDNPEYRDIARYAFEILFGRPDKAFFTMIKESRENVFTLEETAEGDIEYYGYRFAKVPLSGQVA